LIEASLEQLAVLAYERLLCRSALSQKGLDIGRICWAAEL